MLGSTQVNAADPGRLDGSGDRFFAAGLPWRGSHLPAEGMVFGPCAAAYDRRWFDAVAGFDERFFCYYEDIDLAFRIRLEGGACIQVQNAVVRHVGSGIAGRRSAFVHYHSARNRLWLFVKNVPSWGFALLLPAHVALTLLFLAWGAMRGHGGPVASGVWDGLRGLPAIWRERRGARSGAGASGCSQAQAVGPACECR